MLKDLKARQQRRRVRFPRQIIRAPPDYRACFRVKFNEKQIGAGFSFEQSISARLQWWAACLRVRSYTVRFNYFSRTRSKSANAFPQRHWQSRQLHGSHLILQELRADESYWRLPILFARIQQSKIAWAPRHTEFACLWPCGLTRILGRAWNSYKPRTRSNLGRWRWQACIDWIVGV